jgi:TPR repeat
MKLSGSNPSKKKAPAPNSGDSLRGAASSDMEEKYFHSLGALLCEEGRVDEAIEAFRSALDLKDTSYSHYDLGRAYLAKGRLDDAVFELTFAIKMCPSAPEYRYERGLVYRRLGDHVRASSDLAEAESIDPDYQRIDEIKSAVRAIEHGLRDPAMEELCDTAAPKDPDLCAIIDGIRECLRLGRDVMDNSSCPVASCPVYCCHFTEATVCHGLTIGGWKLQGIRAYLNEKGLPADDFIDRLPFRGEEHLRSLIPPNYILKEGEDRFIFHPKRAGGFIDKADLSRLPKSRDCQTLMWINEKAQPCAFLLKKRCMIHDAGDEPNLEACKQFLCLTGFAFVILGHLDIIDQTALEEKSMAELNQLAVESILILFRMIYASSHLNELTKAMRGAIKAAASAERTGDAHGLREKTSEYGRLKLDYDRAIENLARHAADEIEKLLGT